MSKGVGVYVGSNEVIAVSATHAGTIPRIKSFAIEPIRSSGTPESFVGKEAHRFKKMTPEARAIFTALERIGEKGACVTAAVSPSQVATRQFVIPAVPKHEELRAIREEAARHMPFKIEDSFLDYFARVHNKKVLWVTATAIRTSVLEASLQVLREAEAKVLMLEPVHCAVSRAFAALLMVGKARVQGFIVLQSDGNVNVTIAVQGSVGLSRDFLISGNLQEDKQRFCEELSASIDYFHKLTGGESVGQFFLSGSGDLRSWGEALERDFNYKIRFDTPKFPENENVPFEGTSSVFVAFGLALRSLGYRSPLGEVKLLPKEERTTEPRKLWAFLGLQSLLILILFLLVRFAVFQPYLAAIRRPHQDLLRVLAQENLSPGTESLANLENQKKRLALKGDQLQLFYQDPASVFSVLSEIGRGLPRAIALDSVFFEMGKDLGTGGASRGAGKRMSLRGLCYLGSPEKETNVVGAWAKSLASKKAIVEHFPEIKVAEIKREKTENRSTTRFLITNE